ncbi:MULTISPECIES: electron transfer flavoprotein subunit beta/FixA family protein [Weeksella]|uniref:Electron transfer flavoprotein subunit beta n=1 Tax=Weeksella virosa (strain ATCC 43766 / DSM 16922 / JCM 21250 / CCUG 30538 / CDC 9751 / IAM 14551 / NBRC 16016 / NCTC 11634 / CL345/78) TaxID=865938 RepID=F0P007_WEEVC|nr:MULTISPECIES: electron transfer flavoprotein subunit beta/FixA family protein [Weeksella]ADX67354.1 Electron transfer flavoprotein alpha/beta-subunit [Weeksella virosa DSM 16922]MDK7374417.1 electron transfer flavoprotein subunit beta/FixA family protein [Weeksella virosa]MDK7675635.1 electron transfer flavoprotein subunit beta/FixA family protein [Weeksella virosa]OFM81807.1 electron transfer flavoprotein subunit alpha [Weeksella sp. HMSC059D05]SUP53641.1 Electron transfer flavoprotein sma
MKILVCISSVPDTTAKINFTSDGKEFDKNGVQFVINPHDEFSLTRAVELQEKQGATVTILTVGDASVEPVMRKALAIGANDGIRIDADAKDDFFVATQIAKAAKEGGYDLILTGKESIDYNGGAVPGLVAGMLDYGFVNGCIGLEVEGTTAKVVREIDGGKEKASVALPAVIAGQKGMVEESALRIPNMRGIMQARSKQITVVAAEPTETKVTVVGYEKPASRGTVTLVDKDNVAELVRLLHEEAKVI